MAILYSQNWAAGNSTFTTRPDFEYTRGGDGADALYPEMLNAAAVTVSGGALVWDPTSSGAGWAWQLSGCEIGNLALTVPEGYATCTYTVDADALASGYDMPLMIMNPGAQPEVMYSPDFGPGINFDTGAGHDQDNAFTLTADMELIVRLEWKVGLAGYIRLKINGTEIDSVTGDNVVTLDGVGGDQVNLIAFGYYGLIGPLSYIEVGTTEEEPDPPASGPFQGIFITGIRNSCRVGPQTGNVVHGENNTIIGGVSWSGIWGNNCAIVNIASLPTSDPHVAGKYWNDGGVLRTSTG